MTLLRLLFCLALILPTYAQSPEVKRAYEAIPHRYTPFEPGQAKMAGPEKAYLETNFALVNQAVVARVEATQSRSYAGYESKAQSLIRQLKAQKPPSSLKSYHELVIGAVEDQRAYFREWAKSPSAPFNPRHVKVQSASQKLRQAYGILMRQYPKEANQVKEAFFDHLCALDFI